jgi:uncharacterized protein (TIGR02391 family)
LIRSTPAELAAQREARMPGRRPQGPDPKDDVKRLTLEDIEVGIRKLNRRIDEVRALDPQTIRYDDARVESATRNIKADLIDIFGRGSEEYRAHGAHSIGYPGSVYGGSDMEMQHDFAEALPDAVRMLESLIKRLEEKREDLGGDKTAQVRASFAGLDLHPRIGGVCADLYRDGHYRNAVADASVALVNFVKEKSRRHDLDGAGLMTTVFSKNQPILAFNERRDRTEEDEQEGMMHLFLGAVLALRNPRVHTLLDDSPEMALEYIALISLLAKRVDQAKRV